jgi:hypothetical protein
MFARHYEDRIVTRQMLDDLIADDIAQAINIPNLCG